MGGPTATAGTSVMIYSIDVDKNLNQVVGGETNDSAVHGYSHSSTTIFYPLIGMIDSQYNLKAWAKVYDAQNLYVKKVAFNP